MEETVLSKYYLRVDLDKFGFVVDGIHDIQETDIEITNEDYDIFFKLQSEGKQFRVKEVKIGETLFDIIEEYIPEIDTTPQAPTQEERLLALEEAMLMLL